VFEAKIGLYQFVETDTLFLTEDQNQNLIEKARRPLFTFTISHKKGHFNHNQRMLQVLTGLANLKNGPR